MWLTIDYCIHYTIRAVQNNHILSFLINFVVHYLWHRDEVGILLVLLTDVGQPTEDQHSHDNHQHQQSQLLVAKHIYKINPTVGKGRRQETKPTFYVKSRFFLWRWRYTVNISTTHNYPTTGRYGTCYIMYRPYFSTVPTL